MVKLSWRQQFSVEILQQYMRLRIQLKDLESVYSQQKDSMPGSESAYQLNAYAAVVFLRQTVGDCIEMKIFDKYGANGPNHNRLCLTIGTVCSSAWCQTHLSGVSCNQ